MPATCTLAPSIAVGVLSAGPANQPTEPSMDTGGLSMMTFFSSSVLNGTPFGMCSVTSPKPLRENVMS